MRELVLALALSLSFVAGAGSRDPSASPQDDRLDPILFGPEFTFCPDKTLNVSSVLDRLLEHLVDNQPLGSKFTPEYPSKYAIGKPRTRLVSPNGWWLETYSDSDCEEILVRPMTVAMFRHYAADLQDAIFVSAANAGHFPALWQGGGHVNIDTTEFRLNPLLFRNFIVDLLNHNELFMGILDYNFSFTQRPHELANHATVQRAVHKVDRLIKRAGADRITFEQVKSEFALGLPGKSFSLEKLDEHRIEIRGVRPQTSMDVWIRQIDLFEKRIQYLAKFKEPIPYRPRVPWRDVKADTTLEPPIPPIKALQAFYDYVTESGLKIEDHLDYVWPMWNSGGIVKEFLESDWLKEKVRHRDCGELLKVGT